LTLSFILLIVSFAVVALSAMACNWIVYTMIGKVNRKQGEAGLLRFWGSSWRSVSKQYSLLFPNGKLNRALVAAICITCISTLTTLYLLFWAVPRSFPGK
jgi:hypothetical protein